MNDSFITLSGFINLDNSNNVNSVIFKYFFKFNNQKRELIYFTYD
ncbi:hypothetical protein HMPREF9209_0513 [Lactobacillus gasseri 224-1]|jgi:hypothetical protein|uniref:Uncharacterized protein n=3 Tax=Lactobacillus gasseri TaxID=1596 RepID=A0ABY3BB67_LACGS|nr:hypothetical protein N506_0250 [Lactobacillus gasseri DSM 14869]EEQ26387.1 hypothetical protein HMPREF0890_0369 [Lactobacillus gasseri 202-4]EFB63038.1 hypothetical protein HMPREF9209_0513 [Lactobacillus gasseri 224-1]EFQ45930.1 hypothetical protein LBGG_02004 [Lactobacillus gasseri MV-22]KXA27001.1 hypothetical protein HMPREF3210_00536 [Lactobacillus gasseri]